MSRLFGGNSLQVSARVILCIPIKPLHVRLLRTGRALGQPITLGELRAIDAHRQAPADARNMGDQSAVPARFCAASDGFESSGGEPKAEDDRCTPSGDRCMLGAEYALTVQPWRLGRRVR